MSKRTTPGPAQVTRSRGGAQLELDEKLFETARRARAKWLSPEAREIARTLRAAGIEAEPQYRLGNSFYAADFYLPDLKIAVLLDGRINGFRRPDGLKRRMVLCERLGIAAVTGDSAETLRARLAAHLPTTAAALAA